MRRSDLLYDKASQDYPQGVRLFHQEHGPVSRYVVASQAAFSSGSPWEHPLEYISTNKIAGQEFTLFFREGVLRDGSRPILHFCSRST